MTPCRLVFILQMKRIRYLKKKASPRKHYQTELVGLLVENCQVENLDNTLDDEVSMIEVQTKCEYWKVSSSIKALKPWRSISMHLGANKMVYKNIEMLTYCVKL